MGISRVWLRGALASVAVLLLPCTSLAFDVIVFVEGEKQGRIEGDNVVAGREGSIPVLSIGMGVSVPLDSSTGRVSGERVHRPLSFVKEVDSATPKLLKALVTGERLKAVEFRFFRQTASGATEHYFTIELQGAILTDISVTGGANGNRSREHVSFTYQKITWTHEQSGVSTEDDWSQPL